MTGLAQDRQRLPTFSEIRRDTSAVDARRDATKCILISVIARIMHCSNRWRYISASQKCRWGKKNSVAIKSRERKIKMREKTNVFYHVFKKSVWMIRNSPRWLSIRVAYSNSLKYSSRLPMSSVHSSKRSCLSTQYSESIVPNVPFPQAASHTHPSSFSHLLQYPAIPQASPRPPINLINLLHKPITCLQMLRKTRNVCREMRLLAMRD